MKTVFKLSILFILALCAYLQAGSPVVKVTNQSTFSRSNSWFPTFPHGAFNTDTGETLVVWEDGAVNNDPSWDNGEGIALYGRLINAQGKSTSKKIYVGGDVEQQPDVAYNPVTREYLVVFDRQCCIANRPYPNDSIHALRLDLHLIAIGKEFEIIPATKTDRMTNPQVIFNPETQGYSLIWEDWDRSESVGTQNSGIHVIQLDQSGKITGNRVSIAKNPGKSGFYDNSCCGRVLDVAMLLSAKRLLVVFRQRSSGDQVEYWLARIDPKLNKVGAQKFAHYSVDPQGGPNYRSRGASLAVLADGSALVFYADDDGVKKRTISPKGELSRNDSFAFAAPLDTESLFDPTVGFSTTANGTTGLLIATQREYVDTAEGEQSGIAWAQVLDSKGLPVGKPTEVNQAPLDTVTHFGSLLMALPRGQSNTRFEFVWLQTLGSSKVQSTILKLNLDVQP